MGSTEGPFAGGTTILLVPIVHDACTSETDGGGVVLYVVRTGSVEDRRLLHNQRSDRNVTSCFKELTKFVTSCQRKPRRRLLGHH